MAVPNPTRPAVAGFLWLSQGSRQLVRRSIEGRSLDPTGERNHGFSYGVRAI